MYGKIVTGEAFTCRKREQDIIQSNIKNSHNCWLWSRRRAGKTSLVKKVIADNPDLGVVYIDLFIPYNKKDFILKYARAITSKLLVVEENLESTIKNTKKYFSTLKSEISFGEDGFKINFDFEDKDLELALEEVVNLPQKFAEDNKLTSVSIVLDEFQSINTIDEKLLNQLRGHFQQHSKVSYIFLGSKKNKIEGIFSNEDSPFYNFASKVEIEAIKDQEWRLYISKKFSEDGKLLPIKTLNAILHLSNGQPFYTQYFSATVWNLIEREEDLVSDPWLFAKELMTQYESFFRELMEGLSRNQFKTILIAAQNHGENIYSTASLKKYTISKSSAERCIDSLTNMNIIFKENGKYLFSNPILKYWININFK